MFRACVLVIVGLWMAGCTASVPREQVARVSEAYAAAATASTPLLDEYAVAERQLRVAQLKRQTRAGTVLREEDRAVLVEFDPASADLFSDIGEPPTTRAVRLGLATVGRYVEVLTALAEGRNIATVKIQLQILAGSAAGLAGVATGAMLPLAAAAGALGPIIEDALRAQQAAELRSIVLRGVGPVDELLVALQQTAPSMYQALIAPSVRAIDVRLADNPEAKAAELDRIEGYHRAIANYVVLLEQLRTTLVALAAAVEAPDSPVSLASLSAASQRLLEDAEAVRHAYAILRRQPLPPATEGATP